MPTHLRNTDSSSTRFVMQQSLSIKSIPTLFEVTQRNIRENECGMWYWEPPTDSFYYSDSYLSFLGYTDDEFPASIADWLKIIHPDDIGTISRIQKRYMNAATNGNRYQHLLRVRAKNGEYVSVVINGYILDRDANGKATKVNGFHVTCERLKALDHEQQRMKFALQAAEDGIWDWNSETDEVYYSPRYKAIVGYTEEEFQPTLESWSSRVHPDDFESTVALQLKIVNSPAYGDSFECTYRFLHKDGSWKWILGKGVVTSRSADGKALRITGVHIDIDELQDAKEKLIETLKTDPLTSVHSRYSFEQRLHSLTASDYPVSLIYVDTDGLKIVNDLLGHTFGDEYLQKISIMLQHYTRDRDSVFRIGGDEFVILLPGTGNENASEVLSRLQANVEEQNKINGALFVSFGLATASDPTELSTLASDADSHMYQNKRMTQDVRHELLRQHCLQLLTTMNNEDSHNLTA